MAKNIIITTLTLVTIGLGVYLFQRTEPSVENKLESLSKTTDIQADIPKDSVAVVSETDNWVRYTSAEANISFLHPEDWECQTRKVHINHPNWLQTVCDVNGFTGDPSVVVNTPYIDSGEFESSKLALREEITLGDVSVTKEIWTMIPDKYAARDYYGGSVVYKYGNSEETESFSVGMDFSSNVDAQYQSQEEAVHTGDLIVASISR